MTVEVLLFLHNYYYYLGAEDASASLYIRLTVVYTIAKGISSEWYLIFGFRFIIISK